jgi:hypothetical protein
MEMRHMEWPSVLSSRRSRHAKGQALEESRLVQDMRGEWRGMSMFKNAMALYAAWKANPQKKTFKEWLNDLREIEN